MSVTGYAREHRGSGSLDATVALLRTAGCSRIYADTCSGLPNEGPGLLQAIEAARWGRTLIVASVTHLTESSFQYARIADALGYCQIVLRDLEGEADTTTATGRHALAMGVSVAEYAADRRAPEGDYLRRVALLEQWEPRLAATREAAARRTLPELKAEIEKIGNEGDHISAAEFIKRSAPVNAAIRDLDGCTAGAPDVAALLAGRRGDLLAELDAITEVVRLGLMTSERASVARGRVDREIRDVDRRLETDNGGEGPDLHVYA